MSKVVSLNGDPILESSINEDAVTLLEELLKRVKRGEIMGIGVCWVTANHLVGSQWATNGRCHEMAGSIMSFMWDYAKAMNDTGNLVESPPLDEGA